MEAQTASVMQQNSDHIQHLADWLRSFNPAILKNEDDVETKFVLPLFTLLGYLDACRCGKRPVERDIPGKLGRKPEADQVYGLRPLCWLALDSLCPARS